MMQEMKHRIDLTTIMSDQLGTALRQTVMAVAELQEIVKKLQDHIESKKED